MINQFVVGIVGAPFGLEGFVKVKPFSGETDHLLRLTTITLRQEGKERLMAIEKSTVVRGKRGACDIVLMRFAGFQSPEAAKTLRGAELLLNRKDAAPLLPGEYYVEDLKGLTIISDSGQIIGYITDILEGGGGDLVEIQLNDSTLRLVPFRKEFVSGIDLEKRQAIINNLWVLE